MRTIFITSFHGLISRNILATPLLDMLVGAHGFRVVLLVPDYKVEFFKKQYGREGVIIEGVDRRLHQLDLLFRYFSLVLLNTKTLYIKRKTEMKGSGAWLARLIGNRKWARVVFRKASALFTPRGRFRPLLEKYQPNLIFSTDLQNELDARLLHEAKSRKIKIVGMVRSWDNLTSKGVIRVLPDHMVVWNEIIKKEAMDYVDLQPWRVSVIGIPHYDAYVRERCSPRDEFYKRVRLDPQKSFILFAPTGDRYIVRNTIDRDVLAILQEIVPPTHQILVRMPPADTVNLEGLTLSARTRIDEPGTHFGTSKKTSELSGEDDKHLADTIFWCDLLVTGPSTMAIDAAVFDKPTIFIAFDGLEKRPYYEGMKRFTDYLHIQHIIRTGGVRVVMSQDELQQALTDYLFNIHRDHEKRQVLRQRECFRLDGNSSQRLADVLIKIAH